MLLRTLLSIIDTMSNKISPIDLMWGHYDSEGCQSVINDSFGEKIEKGEQIKAAIRDRIETESKKMIDESSEDFTLFNLEIDDMKISCLSLEARDLNHKRTYFLILPINLVNISMMLEILFLFQHTMDNTVELCCLIGKGGEIYRMSRRGCELLGIDPDHLQGANLNNHLISPDNVSTLEKLSHRNQQTEIYLKAKSGKEILCLGSVIPISDCHGEILFYFINITDISHQIRLYSDSVKNNMELSNKNELLIRTQAVLLKTEKMATIGILGSGLAHEINNPLSYLINDIELLKEFYGNFSDFSEKITSNEDKSQISAINKRYEIDYWISELPVIIKEMTEGMDRIAKITHSLRSFSGINRSGIWGFSNLNDSLDEMLLLSLGEYKYILDVQFAKGDIPLVYCNIKEINQAFLSVFLNCIYAIKEYREESEKKEMGLITITTDFLPESEEIRITFSDNGIPFPLDSPETMLDPFYSGWKRKGSSGMGMAIVNDIISFQHRGSVDFSNEEEKKIILTFPISNNFGEE